MKKVLLSIAALAVTLAVNAQTVTGYSAGFDGTENSTGACLLNLKGNSVQGYAGGNLDSLMFLGADPNAKALKFMAKARKVFNSAVSPYLADLFFTLGEDPATASCATYKANFMGVDMTTNNNVSITCKSDMATGDTLEFFLGSSPDDSWPSSTFSFGASKSIVKKIAISDVMTEYNFNYTTLDIPSLSSSNAAWADWDGKGLVNMWGLRTQRANAIIEVGNIKLGDQATGLTSSEVASLGLTFAPNPATETLTVSYVSQAGKNVVVSLSNGVNEVASTVGGDSSATLNVSNLASGLYFATVSVNGAYATTSKVLVK